MARVAAVMMVPCVRTEEWLARVLLLLQHWPQGGGEGLVTLPSGYPASGVMGSLSRTVVVRQCDGSGQWWVMRQLHPMLPPPVVRVHHG